MADQAGAGSEWVRGVPYRVTGWADVGGDMRGIRVVERGYFLGFDVHPRRTWAVLVLDAATGWAGRMTHPLTRKETRG